MVQRNAADDATLRSHPGTEQGDPRIIAELKRALWRNRNNDNPNLLKGTVYYDFTEGRVRIEGGS